MKSNIHILHNLKNKKATAVKIFVTHDKPIGSVRLPDTLLYKSSAEDWMDFCRRLWMGAYEANGDDTINLTIHLKLSESDKMMYELRKWAYGAKMVDNGALTYLVDKNVSKLVLHGVTFKFDLPESI